MDDYIHGSKFLAPGVEFRSAPFYAYNDDLKPDVIRQQMKSFAQGGVGGVNMHARGGLITEYLGEGWWRAIDAGVQGAEENGIKAWFYDENCWPSGNAGGKVPAMSPEYVAQCLIRVDRSAAGTPTAVDGPAKAKVPENDVVLREGKYAYVIERDGGQKGTPPYVDVLNGDVVGAFIGTTYKEYAERCRDKIGTVCPGIFTDEPSFTPRPQTDNSGSIPYTPRLFEVFRQMHGYDLVPKLPLLFEKRDDYARVRIDYYRTISHLFETSYAQQIGDYCKEHNMVFQGHYKGENTPTTVARASGEGMTLYRHMQMPGIDLLGLSQGQFHISKSLSSVANQYGIGWRMCEAYGCSGHNMNFEDRKWIVDWLTCTGIDFIVPHLSLYSMKGERKRDYPPSFMQQPYWRYNRIFEDYAARMCYASSVGKYAAQIVLIHPLESAWIEMDVTKVSGGKQIDMRSPRSSRLEDLLRMMQNCHRDYDLADEQIISEIGRVSVGGDGNAHGGRNAGGDGNAHGGRNVGGDGNAHGGRNVGGQVGDNSGFAVGAMSYRVVVLPDMLTIRESTLGLLEQFHANGGVIIAVGQYPDYVDGMVEPERIAALKKISIPTDMAGLPVLLDAKLTPPFTFTGDDRNRHQAEGNPSLLMDCRGAKEEGGHLFVRQLSVGGESDQILTQGRISGNAGDGYLVQLSNKSRKQSVAGRLKFNVPVQGAALWDPCTGRSYALHPDADGGIDIRFAPAQSWIVTIGGASRGADTSQTFAFRDYTDRPVATLGGKWSGQRVDPNALTLDFARYSTDGGKTFSGDEPVIGIMERLVKKRYQGPMALEYRLLSRTDPRAASLAVEHPETFKSIKINGRELSFKDNGWYIDRAFRLTDLGGAIVKGANVVRFELDFTPATELEAVYVVGDFAVEAVDAADQLATTDRNKRQELIARPVHAFSSFAIASEQREFGGDLTGEGYPFFAGEFLLRKEFDAGRIDPSKRYFIVFPDYEAVVVNVAMNGTHIPQPIVFNPHEAEITGLLKSGANRMTIALTGSLRNLLGPHHNKGGELTMVGPESFTGRSSWTSSESGDSDWYDKRIEGKARLWRDDYYMVPFGLLADPIVVERTYN